MKKIVKLMACVIITEGIMFNTFNVFAESKKVYSKISEKDVKIDTKKENVQAVPKNSLNVNRSNDTIVKVTIGSKIANINGKDDHISVAPYYQQQTNNVMIPLRFILKSLGIGDKNIKFNPKTKTIIVIKGNDILEFQNNNNKYKKNGEYIFEQTKNKILAPVVEVKEGVTFISLTTFEKIFNLNVKWDSSLKTATIVFNNSNVDNNINSKMSTEEMEKDVIKLVNEERSKHGLGLLKVDETLTKAARLKSNDMQQNEYFDHESPAYGGPTDMLKDIFGYEFNGYYLGAGENIASGQTTARQVVDDWLNSKAHKENILNPNYKYIGVGLKDKIWTQLFVG